MRLRFRTDDLVILYLLSVILCCLSLSVGHRPLTIGTDTPVYSLIYEAVLQGEDQPHKFEFLFDLLMTVFARLSLSVGAFFSFLSALSLVLIAICAGSLNVFFGRRRSDPSLYIYIFIMLLLSVFFYSAQVNVMRHGLACFALFCFYSSLLTKRFGAFLVFSALLALGFHSTSILYILVSLGLLFRYSVVLAGVVLSTILYLTGMSEQTIKIASSLSGINLYGRITDYGANEGYRSGVRADFMFFSIGLGLILHGLGRFFVHYIERDRYMKLVKLYWLLIIPFTLLGFGAYSDRLLLNAWLYFSVVFGVFLATRFFYTSMACFFGVILLFIVIVVYVFIAQGKLWM